MEFDEFKLDILKQFVVLCKLEPGLLYQPKMVFLKEWLESLGARIPPPNFVKFTTQPETAPNTTNSTPLIVSTEKNLLNVHNNSTWSPIQEPIDGNDHLYSIPPLMEAYSSLSAGLTYSGEMETAHHGPDESNHSLLTPGGGGDSNSPDNVHGRRRKGKKFFACSTCGKQFSQRPSLRNHEMIHTGEKSFLCMYCGKTFRQKHHLLYHERIHTDSKPYECHVCKKPFSRSDTLSIHLRIHTGEKPFICNLCNRQYASRSSYIGHMRTHRKMASVSGLNLLQPVSSFLMEPSFPSSLNPSANIEPVTKTESSIITSDAMTDRNL